MTGSPPHWTQHGRYSFDPESPLHNDPAAQAEVSNPISFLNILNDTYRTGAASSRHFSDTMTQNGSNLDGAQTGGGLSPTSHHQLPHSSRAFEMFMTRATLDTMATQDPVWNRSAVIESPRIDHSFPRPSYLEGSHYLTRLEAQTRETALSQREVTSVPAANGNGFGPQSGKSPAPPSFHLGIAREVVERIPAHEQEEDAVDPLPSRWATGREDKALSLEVLGHGLEVKYTGPRNPNERDYDACAIRADYSMPLQCGLYYYEVTILSKKHTDTTIGIGFSAKSVSLNRAPGWEPESWGYHGDDGHTFASQNVGKHYGPTFSTGDTIGCGVNFRTGTAFFTKNGRFLGQAFKEVKGKLYPSVGMKKPGEHIRVNFGQTPFIFDIDSLMKNEIHRLEEEIKKADTSKLAPHLNETELIQQLVLQFLQHDGYVDTARAFASEIQAEKQALCLDPNEQVPGIDIRDDEDANNRQRIRRAILEGDVDKALKHTNAYYPQVLKQNEQVYFRLKCRKFIELIRHEAEINLVGGDKRKHNGHNRLPGASEDMELDDDMEDLDGGIHKASGDLTEDALVYGQSLQAEYAGDERRGVRTALEEIFSLMAYQNPLKEAKVAYLLERKGRVAVAEELNSAILQSLGKSSRAALETLYAQTSNLLDDLAETGGPGAFVTLKGILDEVEPKKTDL
ncbi:hypothetical protein N0V93_000458 [Gnomoniopsis smithogilvyi]|uniref:Protein SSH4 n=1 Tax=Gnomoniopsis smithogilvyi TaxID=1191159 RepID=A0A9W8Z3Q2_9PEZI|nr:hypothetical protein N0V93_000458 [Gnomoniopsis smithogilvyi]